jgi:fructose-1,6-bisphosphatase
VWGWVVRKQCNTGTLGVFSELYYCDTKVVAFKYRKDIMMTEKEKKYLIKLAESVSIIQDCLFDIAKRLEELEKENN